MSPDAPVILLAEDNDAHARLVIRHLGQNHCVSRIVHVRDGEEALDYLHRRAAYADPESSPRPQLLLLDLRLPKVDGLEVLRMIKQTPSTLDIPVVVLTTSSAEPDLSRAYELRANSYLVKPMDFVAFSRLMNDIGMYWLAWNRLPGGEDGFPSPS